MISCVALTSAKMSVEAAEPVRTASSPLSGSRHFGKKKNAGVSQSRLGSGLFLPTSRNFGIIVSVIVAETFTRVLEIDHKIITARKSLFFCLCLNSNLCCFQLESFFVYRFLIRHHSLSKTTHVSKVNQVSV